MRPKAHQPTEELQKQTQGLAKKLRQHPLMTDEMYQLFTLFNARLRLLEEAEENRKPLLDRMLDWESRRLGFLQQPPLKEV